MLPENTKIALIHDDLIQQGGAERLFTTMLEVWPQADVYVSMATEEWKERLRDYDIKTLRTSFMQKLPLKEKIYRQYFPLYPLAFESFDLSQYDLVISSSTRFSHGVITRPETVHICYMNSPGRMFWEPQAYFSKKWQVKLLSPFLSWLRIWDYQAAQRVDYFVANSKTPAGRISKHYGREAAVIYPYVDLERFNVGSSIPGGSEEQYVGTQIEDNDFFLIVSRLAPWKRIDIAVDACNQLDLPLKVVGSGPDYARLKRLAGTTVEVLGRLPDEDVVQYYYKCRGFIFPQKEDFGITPLEAMAAGKPVIAYKAGGALETVLPGKTGEFFYPQETGALVEVLKNFDSSQYNSSECKKQANKFSKARFKESLLSLVEEFFATYRQKL